MNFCFHLLTVDQILFRLLMVDEKQCFSGSLVYHRPHFINNHSLSINFYDI